MNRTLKAIVSLMLMMVFAVGCTKPDEPEPEPQTIVAPEGAVGGLFSVSENTKVYFSRGNLQHQPSTHTWRFADEQYDYLKDTTRWMSILTIGLTLSGGARAA